MHTVRCFSIPPIDISSVVADAQDGSEQHVVLNGRWHESRLGMVLSLLIAVLYRTKSQPSEFTVSTHAHALSDVDFFLPSGNAPPVRPSVRSCHTPVR